MLNYLQCFRRAISLYVQVTCMSLIIYIMAHIESRFYIFCYQLVNSGTCTKLQNSSLLTDRCMQPLSYHFCKQFAPMSSSSHLQESNLLKSTACRESFQRYSKIMNQNWRGRETKRRCDTCKGHICLPPCCVFTPLVSLISSCTVEGREMER